MLTQKVILIKELQSKRVLKRKMQYNFTAALTQNNVVERFARECFSHKIILNDEIQFSIEAFVNVNVINKIVANRVDNSNYMLSYVYYGELHTKEQKLLYRLSLVMDIDMNGIMPPTCLP